MNGKVKNCMRWKKHVISIQVNSLIVKKIKNLSVKAKFVAAAATAELLPVLVYTLSILDDTTIS